jgi:peptidoglycan/xylan/chitin deacetylase (PgdA/CDA1 family)
MSTKKFPVCFSFDVDCQTLWTSRDPENYNRPVTLSLGNYGAYEGVPRILRVLEKYEVPATFFIPGEAVDLFPEMCMDIFKAGHEIGNHGYSHVWPEKFATPEDEAEEYVKANEKIKGLTGVTPKGFRSPAWEFSKYTADILVNMGFIYSSNMMHTEKIHQLEVFGKKKKLVEIPIHWAMDDAAYWLYSTKIIGKAMQPLDAVEQVFIRWFDVIYHEFKNIPDRADTVYVLTCHPQVIGLPPRMVVVENVIKHIKKFDDVEFVRMGDLAERHLDLIK